MTTLNQFRLDYERYLRLYSDALRTEIKATHYQRNMDNQPESQSYLDMLLDGYDLASEEQSAFHRIGVGHEKNSKFTRNDGREYVFRYDERIGQFQMVTDETNMGTFNFGANPASYTHVMADIAPWVLWGNSEYDAAQWTAKERWDKLQASIPGGVYGLIRSPVEPLIIDKVYGTAGLDRWFGTAEDQRFIGNSGWDVVDYSTSPSAVVASLKARKGYEGYARHDEYQEIKSLKGSDFGDILVGNDGHNTLEGGAGNDILVGLDGDDYIDGGSGFDTLKGGKGDDTFELYARDQVVEGGDGEDTLVSWLQTTFVQSSGDFTGIEIYKLTEDTVGAQYALNLYGSGVGETLIGNRFDNYLRAGSGRDVLNGGGGVDDLEGGAGADTYVFEGKWDYDIVGDDGGFDTLYFPDLALDDLRLFRASGVNSGHLDIFNADGTAGVSVWNQFSGDGSDRIEVLRASDGEVSLIRGLPLGGTDGGDAIEGTTYSDLIEGFDGDDYIRGGGGPDIIIGGDGDDTLVGGGGDDTFIFTPGFGEDRISENGRYAGEYDSPGDTLEFRGIGFASLRQSETVSNTLISVVNAVGDVTDSILLMGQTSDNPEGRLVEWISFDGVSLLPIDILIDFV